MGEPRGLHSQACLLFYRHSRGMCPTVLQNLIFYSIRIMLNHAIWALFIVFPVQYTMSNLDAPLSNLWRLSVGQRLYFYRLFLEAHPLVRLTLFGSQFAQFLVGSSGVERGLTLSLPLSCLCNLLTVLNCWTLSNKHSSAQFVCR